MKNAAYDIKAIDHKIRLLQQTADELKQLSGGFPALDRNIIRILASLKMLKINISDAAELGLID
jgi:hypothetical protein